MDILQVDGHSRDLNIKNDYKKMRLARFTSRYLTIFSADRNNVYDYRVMD